MTCNKCGRKLIGLDFDYGDEWTCCDCTDEKDSVLHCETGCVVKAVNLDNGYPSDSKQARAYLAIGNVYEVKDVSVGGYTSEITLTQLPGIRFNTVHFKRIK